MEGRVCVPLLPSEIDKFDPDTVPTVGQLLLELEAAARAGDDKAGWERTSLKPYIELFERHVEGILKDARGEKRGEYCFVTRERGCG
jgi:DNA primase small subunit